VGSFPHAVIRKNGIVIALEKLVLLVLLALLEAEVTFPPAGILLPQPAGEEGKSAIGRNRNKHLRCTVQ